MSNSTNLGVMAQMQLEDPIFSEILWKMTPTSLAVRLSQGQYKTWNYIQLLSRKLVDVAIGRCPRSCVPYGRNGPNRTRSPPMLVHQSYPGRNRPLDLGPAKGQVGARLAAVTPPSAARRRSGLRPDQRAGLTWELSQWLHLGWAQPLGHPAAHASTVPSPRARQRLQCTGRLATS